MLGMGELPDLDIILRGRERAMQGVTTGRKHFHLYFGGKASQGSDDVKLRSFPPYLGGRVCATCWSK